MARDPLDHVLRVRLAMALQGLERERPRAGVYARESGYYFDEAVERARSAGDAEMELALLSSLAGMWVDLGDAPRARRVIGRALSLCRDQRLPEGDSSCVSAAFSEATLDLQQGRGPEASRKLSRLLEITRTARLPEMYCRISVTLPALTDRQRAQLRADAAWLSSRRAGARGYLRGVESQRLESEAGERRGGKGGARGRGAPADAPPAAAGAGAGVGAGPSTTPGASKADLVPSSWLSKASDEDAGWIFFSLAKDAKRLGQRRLAWAAWAAGNGLQAPTSGHDPNEAVRRLEAIHQYFDETSIRSGPWRRMLGPGRPAGFVVAGEAPGAPLAPPPLASPGAGPPPPAVAPGLAPDPPRLTPIFVVGVPRSGSTLLEQILASHPDVWGAGEDTALAPLLPDLIRALQSSGNDPSAARAVGKRYLAEMRFRLPDERREASFVVDKMLGNVWNVGFIKAMLPESVVVLVERHPADVALSCFAQAFNGRGISWAHELSGIARVIQAIGRVADHWDRVLPGAVLRVHYESLVRSPREALEPVLRLAGLTYHPSMESFHENGRQVTTASLEQVRQPLYKTAQGAWAAHAAPDELGPLLLDLKEDILAYEARVGLPSSAATLDALNRTEGGWKLRWPFRIRPRDEL